MLVHLLSDLPDRFGNAAVAMVLLVALAAGPVFAWWWASRHPDRLLATARSVKSWLAALPPVRRLALRHPGWVRFLGDRVSPAGYLGLHLTLGLLVSAVALFAFADIADDIRDREDMARFDHRIVEYVHQHATASGVRVCRAVALVGSVAWIVGLGVAVALVLWFAGKGLVMTGWIVALAGGGLLEAALKHWFHRPRPHLTNPLLSYTTWSFPSGHAMGSVVAYGMLAYLVIVLILRRTGARVAVAFGAAALVLAIGFSRVYLGAHYPTDVMGGFAAGATWLAACVTGLEVARRQQQQSMTPPESRDPAAPNPEVT